jgi:hypothetical protein
MTCEHARKVVFICPNLKVGGAERRWGAIPATGLSERGFAVSVIRLTAAASTSGVARTRCPSIACARLRHRADPIGLARERCAR